MTNLARRLFLGQATAGLAALGAMSSGANPQLVDKRSDWEIAEFGRLVKNPYRVKRVFDESSALGAGLITSYFIEEAPATSLQAVGVSTSRPHIA